MNNIILNKLKSFITSVHVNKYGMVNHISQLDTAVYYVVYI